VAIGSNRGRRGKYFGGFPLRGSGRIENGNTQECRIYELVERRPSQHMIKSYLLISLKPPYEGRIVHLVGD
jgi:hypothetical protein